MDISYIHIVYQMIDNIIILNKLKELNDFYENTVKLFLEDNEPNTNWVTKEIFKHMQLFPVLLEGIIGRDRKKMVHIPDYYYIAMIKHLEINIGNGITFVYNKRILCICQSQMFRINKRDMV